MGRFLLLIIPFFMFSCFDFSNPLDPKADEHNIYFEGPSSDTSAPVPGNDGIISITQSTGKSYITFSTATDDGAGEDEILYRGLLSFGLEIETGSRFNYFWSQTGDPLYIRSFEVGQHMPMSLELFEHNPAENSYSFPLFYDSGDKAYFNIQSSDYSNNQSVYTQKVLEPLPSFNSKISIGSSADDHPINNHTASASETAIDSQGNIYLAIAYNGSINAPLPVGITNPGTSSVVLIKFDSQFNYQWHRTITAPAPTTNVLLHYLHVSDQNEILLSVSFDGSSTQIDIETEDTGINVAHSSSSFPTNHDAVVIEYDQNGTYEFYYHFGADPSETKESHVFVKKILQDSQNNRYFIGMSINSIRGFYPWNESDIQNITSGSIHTGYGFIIQEDQNHNFMYYNDFGEIDNMGVSLPPQFTVSDAVITNNDHIFITGSTEASFDPGDQLGSTPDNLIVSGNPHIYLLELDKTVFLNSKSVTSMDPAPDSWGNLETGLFGEIYLGLSLGDDFTLANGWTGSEAFGSGKEFLLLKFYENSNEVQYFITDTQLDMKVQDIKMDKNNNTLYMMAKYVTTPEFIDLDFDKSKQNDRTLLDYDNSNLKTLIAAYPFDGDEILAPVIKCFRLNYSSYEPFPNQMSIKNNTLVFSGTYVGVTDTAIDFPEITSPENITSAGFKDIFAVSLELIR